MIQIEDKMTRILASSMVTNVLISKCWGTMVKLIKYASSATDVSCIVNIQVREI